MAPRHKRQRLFGPLDAGELSKRPHALPSAEEEALEAELFGLLKSKVSGRAPQTDADDDEWHGIEDEQLFFIDTTNAQRSDGERDTPNEVPPARKAKKAALWIDPADKELSVSLQEIPRLRKLRRTAQEDVVDGEEYERRLRKQFEKSHPSPAWAATARKGAAERKTKNPESPAGMSSILKTARAGISSKRGAFLRSGELQISRLKDANAHHGVKSQITALGFHPNVSVLYTADRDKRLRLFHIDGTSKPLLQTLHVPELPIEHAAFNPTGDNLILAGPRPYFFTYDLQSGRLMRSSRGLWNSGMAGLDTDKPTAGIMHMRHSPDGKLLACSSRRGYVHLLDTRAAGSGMVLGQLRHSSSGLAGLVWSPDASTLLTAGQDAQMYIWDMRTQSCTSKWTDEGGFGLVGLEGDRNGSYVATSASTGVVNVYDGAKSMNANTTAQRPPLKALLNLTTAISSMRFNADAQLLAIASDKKKDQLKMVHLPSLTVYQNWPTSTTPLGRVSAIDFSGHGEYMAIGNVQGRVLLYNLAHYNAGSR